MADVLRSPVFLAGQAVSLLGDGIAILAVPLLVLELSRSPLLASLAFAAGVVTVCTDTALAIAVRDVFAGPRLISVNSWLESANQGGQIIGPSAAGLLAAAGLLRVGLLIDATFLYRTPATSSRRRAASETGAHAALVHARPESLPRC
jgi:MFS family permease